MIFSKIAIFSQRYRVFVVIFWLIAAAGLYFLAPSFSSVSTTDEAQFLPQDTESAMARAMLKEKFANTAQGDSSSGTVIVYNANGLSDKDLQDSQAIRDWLVSSDGPEGVKSVTSIFDSDLLRQVLVSKDGTAMMMQINLSAGPLSNTASTVVTQTRQYMSANYPELKAYLTGETGLYYDLFQSIQQTMSRTTIVTIILVLIILLIIYRSPIAALLPLVTIGCSYLVTLGLLGFIGHAGIKFFSLSQAYLIVIIFGVGTDYCLFIVSRFREELKKNSPQIALNYSMKRIGPVIAASAATVIVAFLCLGLSKFGMNQTSGIALALGIAVTLIAGLTLIPALMSLLSKCFILAEMGGRDKLYHGRGSWAKVGEWLVKRPIWVAVPIIVLLLIPYIGFSNFTQTDDLVGQMPSNTQSVQGYRILQNHFNTGELSPMYLLVDSSSKDLTQNSAGKS